MSPPIEVQDEASTELSPEEREGLIPSYVTLRSELNAAEQANIVEAEDWALRRKRDVLNERFLNDLHKRMFGKVWDWAGSFRRTGKNIGVDAYLIGTELGQLLDDTRYHIENDVYTPVEIAARLHHRLVQIHLYPNGNGRHARLATDLLLIAISQEPFSWGSESLVNASETRHNYIAALRAADNHEIGPLMGFVVS